MLQERELRAPRETYEAAPQQSRTTRLRISLLIGAVLTAIFILLEAVFLLLFNPFSILGNGTQRFIALLGLPIHTPVVLLILLAQYIVFSLLAFLLVKPGALLLYLRQVRKAQEPHMLAYTPLEMSTHTRRAIDVHEQDGTSSALSTQEEQMPLPDLVQREDMHQLLLGAPGSGKTTALLVYQYRASQRPLDGAFKGQRIPIYIPMEQYSLYLKKVQPIPIDEGDTYAGAQGSLLDFMHESDLPGMRMLRPYLFQLVQQGRLLLLCDGLDEIDSAYLAQVCLELAQLAREESNRLVVSCRMVDYRGQRELVQLVDDGWAERIVVSPLQPTQISEFVETYITNQGRQWRHTVGQVMQVIEHSRLRYHTGNPMLLFTLLKVIDTIGVERGKQIDTRARLLREAVRQRIATEQRQARWNGDAPREQEVVHFLSEVACAARWVSDQDAIQLRVATPTRGRRARPDVAELAEGLQVWLDEHPAASTFAATASLPQDDMARLLQFVLATGLISISSESVLSFEHELFAEYFVALFLATEKREDEELRRELLAHIESWCGPVALWAGLHDEPLALAERFVVAGSATPDYALQALALALLCIGVQWTPIQSEQQIMHVPLSVEQSLAQAVRNQATCEALARIFMHCAEEGGQEIYYALLPLVMVEGIENLLILLDRRVVPDLFFTYLQSTVDNVAYDAQVKRLVRVLARFGGSIVERSAQACLYVPERGIRLRAAAINILGGTNDARAVEPLVNRLDDSDPFIVERAVNALFRLGPELTLSALLRTLERHDPQSPAVHRASLIVLARFLDEPSSRVTPQQHQRIIDAIVPMLSANYQPEIQQQAMQILIHQFQNSGGVSVREEKKIVESLVQYLPAPDGVVARNAMQTLSAIGVSATPSLLPLLNHPSELIRARVVETFKTIHDLRVLPRLLQMVGDPSQDVQQQVSQALQLYAPESISGLIDLVLADANDAVAERAALILSSIGEPVVEPVAEALANAVPHRMRLLVQVLERVHDTRSLPALIALLEEPQLDTLLAMAVVQALGQFDDARVVPPLLTVLASTNPMLYEEGINALSQLGDLAFDALVAALDVQQVSPVTQRVQRALLGMTPFPAEQLMQALEQASRSQAQQILAIFKMQGTEAAQVLVGHLRDSDKHVYAYVLQTLNDMPGPVVVPALLEVLNQADLRSVVNSILLRYPEAAISPLVELLGEQERGDAAAAILPRFGVEVLRPLVSGLDDQRVAARERAQRILIALVRQSDEKEEVLREAVHLFNPPLPSLAREALLSVLTSELADVSLPALLAGLEDAYLIEDVAEAWMRLSRRPGKQEAIVDLLIRQLSGDERRRGAETALVKIGAPTIPRVGALIADSDTGIAGAAKQILRDIGVPALPFIWNAHSDQNNPARRAAALEVFHSMPTDVIKDELIALLVSNRPEDIAMAVSLLLDRIDDESQQFYADRIMVPELIAYIQTHGVEETNLRVIALLLLLGEHAIVDHLVQSLDDYPQHRQQLTYIPLLLGAETQEALQEVFSDPDASSDLRAELGAILGMMVAPVEVIEAAQSLSTYGLSANSDDVLFPDQMAISLRALGGLLAGGHWDAPTLREIRANSREGSAEHELVSALLGWRYEPQLRKLATELQNAQETHKRELMMISTRLMAEQNRALSLEDELEKAQREHGFSTDELDKTKREQETLRGTLAQSTKDKNALRGNLEQAIKEKNTLNAQLNQVQQEKIALQEKYQDLIRRINQADA